MINDINSLSLKIIKEVKPVETQVEETGGRTMHRKKHYYVSHPFTGFDYEQEANRQEAREITAWLKKRYPNYIFINALDAFQYAELVPEWGYNDILSQCLELLKDCDGIVLTGDWFNSNGCQKEKQMAERLDLDIWYLEDWKKEFLNNE